MAIPPPSPTMLAETNGRIDCIVRAEGDPVAYFFPEPATIAMLALGAFGLLRKARAEDKSPKNRTDTAGTLKKNKLPTKIYLPRAHVIVVHNFFCQHVLRSVLISQG